MRRTWLALLLLLVAGCASWAPWPFRGPSGAALARADRLAAEGDYGAALAAYDQFLAEYPDDGEAARARMSREPLAELVRLRQELARLRADLARREADLVKVRADLERLKQIDLRLERRGRK